MAETGFGASLVISDDIIKNLDKADEKINNLAKSSKETSKAVVDAFSQMANGINPFIDKLKEAQAALGKLNIGAINSGNTNLDSLSSGLTKTKEEAEKAANAMVMVGKEVSKVNSASTKNDSNSNELKKMSERYDELSKKVEAYNIKRKEGTNTIKDATEKDKHLQEMKAIEAKIAIVKKEQETAKLNTNIFSEHLNNLTKGTLEHEKSRVILSQMSEYYKRQDETKKAQIKDADAYNKKKEAEIKIILRNAKAEETNEARRQRANDKAIKDADRLAAAQEKARLGTFSGSMGMEEATMAQRIAKIKQLQIARAGLVKTDANYRNQLEQLNGSIKRLNSENSKAIAGSKELNSQHSSLINTSDQLMRKLALVFSVSQIQGYVMNMIKVRGEFELQNAALAAILQNKDNADKLFGQITKLAVQSPFQLKELITYTKQLAAYRVETEKLFDTTKMLADVSAGLGVDMNRLILAYGQVKAANYLRGTELRQFSEAGINMLGELSTYFTELRGHAISVADVFEMVSKRMVKFSDVDAIFKKLTSEGGIFFKMQEKQAETLAGQMSNLRDSIDIMLNDIGKSNDVILKDSIMSVKQLIINWRDIAFVLKIAGASFAAISGSIMLAKIGSSQFATALFGLAVKGGLANGTINTLTRSISRYCLAAGLGKTATKGLLNGLAGIATVGASAAITAIAIGLTYLVVEATKSIRQARELKNSLDAIFNEGDYNANKLSSSFKDLAKTALDSTKSTKEQSEALETLRNKYSDILPSQTLTRNGLLALKGDYESVTKAIYAKIEAQTKEKQIQAVEDIYGKNVLKSVISLKKMIVKEYGVFAEDANEIISQARQAIEDGSIKNQEQLSAFLEKTTEKVTGLKRDFQGTYTALFGTSFSGKNKFQLVDLKEEKGEVIDFFNAVSFLKKEISKVEDISLGINYNSEYEAMDKYHKSEIEYINKAKELVADTSLEIKGIPESLAEKVIKARAIVAAASTGEKGYILSEEQKKLEISRMTEIVSLFEQGAIEIKTKYNNMINPMGETGKRVVQEWKNTITQISGSESENMLKNIIEDSARASGVAIDNFSVYFKAGDEELKNYTSRLRDSLNDNMKLLSAYSSFKNEYQKSMFLVANRLTEDDIVLLEKESEALRKILAIISPDIKNTGKGGKGDKNIHKERLDLIKKTNSEYESLLKNYDKETAKLKVQEAYKDAFKEAGLSNTLLSMDFDKAGIVKQMQELSKKVGGKTKLEFEKAIADLTTELDINIQLEGRDKLVKEIDAMFSGYELSLELEKMELPPDFAKSLAEQFGFDYITLDGLSDRLNELKDKFVGTEGIKIWTDYERKVAEINKNGIETRMKDLSKYLIKAKDERVRIEEEALKEIAKVNESKELNKDQKKVIKENIQKETKAKLAKVDWDELKELDLYKKSFEDLERLGTTSLNIILAKLEDFAAKSGQALDVTGFRELMNNIKSIREETERRDPFKAMIEGISEYREAIGEIIIAQRQLEISTDNLKEKEGLKVEAERQVEEAESAVGVASLEEKGQAMMQLNIAQTQLNYATQAYNKALKEQESKTNKVIDAEDKKKAALAKSVKSIESSKDAFQSMGDAITNSIDLLKDLAEGLGMAFDPETEAVISSISKALGIVTGALGVVLTVIVAITIAGTAMMVVLWPLLAIALALASVFAIVAIGDAKKEKQIKKEQERVEKLEKAYERLEKAIQAAYSFENLEKSTKAAEANIRMQIRSYQAMIKAEKDKKKTDKDKIKEWENTIEDLKEAQVNLRKDFIETLGGFGSEEAFKDAAKDFTDSWLDAFKETGDGLSGLKDQFDKWIDNAVRQQILLKLSNQYIKPILENMDKMFAEGSAGGIEVTKAELDALKEMMDKNAIAFDEAAKKYLEQLGILGDYGGGGANLSGLQKGIQGVTEETASALEALLNSMRFFSADSNINLKNIYAIFSDTSGSLNPMLAELKVQTKILSGINNKLASIITTAKQGAYGIRIV